MGGADVEAARVAGSYIMDIKTLIEELEDVSGAEWFNLGINLKVKHEKLKEIEANHRGDVRRCKTEMLQVWLEGDRSSAPVKTLAAALETMGKRVLARRIQQKYNVPVIAETTKGSLQQPRNISHELLAPTSKASKQNVHDMCLTDQLDKDAQEEYARFVLEVTKLLRQNPTITVDELLLAWSFHDDSIPVSTDLREANSVTSFIQALRRHQTWYHYRGIRFLATHFGGKDGEKLVGSYEKRLKPHVKKMVGKRVPKKASRLVVKINWQQYNDQDIVHFRNTLAHVLKREPHEFVFKTVRCACIELIFVIPTEVVHPIKTIVQEKTRDLIRLEVLTITIDGECIWSETGTFGKDEVETMPPTKRLKILGNISGTVRTSHQQQPIYGHKTKRPILRGGPHLEAPPQKQHWSQSPVVVLAFTASAMLLVAIGAALLFWEGLKPDITISSYGSVLGSLSLLLGVICCSYSPIFNRRQCNCKYFRYCMFVALYVMLLLWFISLFG